MSEQNESTLQMPVMPALWDKPDVCVSHKQLSGSLAHWAVAQSPYTVPENLGAAIEQFMAAWPPIRGKTYS